MKMCNTKCYVEAHRSNVCVKMEQYALSVLKKSKMSELTAEEKKNLYESMERDGCKVYRHYINMKKYQRLRRSRRDYRLDAYLYIRRRKRFYEKIKALGDPQPPNLAIGNAEATVIQDNVTANDAEVEIAHDYDHENVNEVAQEGPHHSIAVSDDEMDKSDVASYIQIGSSDSSISSSQTVIRNTNPEYLRFNHLSSERFSELRSQVFEIVDDDDDDGICDDAYSQPSSFSNSDPNDKATTISQPVENYSQFEHATNLITSTQTLQQQN